MRQTGAFYEQQAARYLEEHGLTILERNFRCRFGEIDIIATDGQYLIFAEVKYRSSSSSGSSLSAVNLAKQRNISRAAGYYLTVNRHRIDLPCRFDVIGFDKEEIRWIRNAFDYRG